MSIWSNGSIFLPCTWERSSPVSYTHLDVYKSQDYISTTKKLITEINKSATATAALYTTASEEMKKLERLKREQYNALTTAYAFYTDELRIKRFNETLGTVKRNLQMGFSVIEANPQASFFFRDRLIELIAEVNLSLIHIWVSTTGTADGVTRL